MVRKILGLEIAPQIIREIITPTSLSLAGIFDASAASVPLVTR